MAPLQYLSYKNNLLFLYLIVILFLTGFPFCPNSTNAQSLTNDFKGTTRVLLSDADFDDLSIVAKKKPALVSNKNQTKSVKSVSNSPKNQTKLIKTSPFSAKNQTKLIKTTSSSAKNQTKLIKSALSSPKNQTKLVKITSSSPKNQTKLVKSASSLPKNQTKPIKLTSESAKNKTKIIKPTKETLTPIKTQLKKLNSTKAASNPIKKASDLTKSSPPKIKTTKTDPKSKKPDKTQPQKQKTHKFFDQEDEEEDLVSEFRDLPSRFQETLLPDLEKISLTSKDYLTRYNKQITKGFKPYVGTKYAATIASFVSFAFIIIPLILVSLLFNRIKSYFSLQKVLIFIQVYLCIYFYILSVSSLVTGLEPLRFFYAASRSTYICVQVLQTLGYVLYLLMLLMYLVLVFSSETGPGSKLVGLAQTFVGFAVGLHYYVTVFHRVVLRQPPKTSWRVHGIYATCYLVICLLATADRRKKAYLEEGGEEGKKN